MQYAYAFFFTQHSTKNKERSYKYYHKFYGNIYMI